MFGLCPERLTIPSINRNPVAFVSSNLGNVYKLAVLTTYRILVQTIENILKILLDYLFNPFNMFD